MRVAICGAGPSGLSQLHAFESARQNGCEIPEIVCFEKQRDLGGQWNYSWLTGFDDQCEPVHSSMYDNLWTNIPKECSEFIDYPFDKHFGQSIPSFFPRSVMLDYIQGYAKANNVLQYIQFSSVVRWICYCEEKRQFEMVIQDLKNNQTRVELFDYVIVAAGHFATANFPYFDGIETFRGRLLHSHDFRFAHEFKGQHVLIIGNGISGEDIALQLYKYGAKSVTISYRTQPKNFKCPEQIREVPLVTKIVNQTVYFQDGSSEEVQSIIVCTGYLHHFPFIHDSLRLKTSRTLYPPGLYKTIFFIDQPRIMYLGMQQLTFSFNIGNIQAWVARDFILRKLTLPSTKEEMQSDMASWQMKAQSVANITDYINFNKEYVLDLVRMSSYPPFDLDGMIQIFVDLIKTRTENLLTYREKTYTSTITKTIASPHHTHWIDEFDSRLENFIEK